MFNFGGFEKTNFNPNDLKVPPIKVVDIPDLLKPVPLTKRPVFDEKSRFDEKQTNVCVEQKLDSMSMIVQQKNHAIQWIREYDTYLGKQMQDMPKNGPKVLWVVVKNQEKSPPGLWVEKVYEMAPHSLYPAMYMDWNQRLSSENFKTVCVLVDECTSHSDKVNSFRFTFQYNGNWNVKDVILELSSRFGSVSYSSVNAGVNAVPTSLPFIRPFPSLMDYEMSRSQQGEIQDELLRKQKQNLSRPNGPFAY